MVAGPVTLGTPRALAVGPISLAEALGSLAARNVPIGISHKSGWACEVRSITVTRTVQKIETTCYGDQYRTYVAGPMSEEVDAKAYLCGEVIIPPVGEMVEVNQTVGDFCIEGTALLTDALVSMEPNALAECSLHLTSVGTLFVRDLSAYVPDNVQDDHAPFRAISLTGEK